MIKKLLYTFFLFCFLASCKKQNNDIFFGGKIIHPKSKYLILCTMDKAIDTIYLNNNNRFSATIKNANEGLYYFKHGVENQYMYLEPNDSIILRLNTWDFDESLVFTGKGAERNNMLIDCFLQYEKENQKFYYLNKLNPNSFKRKTDSIIALKEKKLKNYINEHPNETKGFINILKIALTYPVYSRIERYPILHAKFSEHKKIKKFKYPFHKYRETININNDSLMYYPPYSKYVRDYLYNHTYSSGYEFMKLDYTSDFTIDLLKTINEKITLPKSKNAFLRQTVVEHFYKKSSCVINEKTFETYFKLTTNTKDKDRIQLLLEDVKKVHRNRPITNFEIYDVDGNKTRINSVIKDKKTLVFFWNPEFTSNIYISRRINLFKIKNPDVEYITIKINSPIYNTINNIDIKNQFYIDNNSNANSFLTSKLPRSILVDENGIIVNGYASISSRKIHDQIKKLKQKN